MIKPNQTKTQFSSPLIQHVPLHRPLGKSSCPRAHLAGFLPASSRLPLWTNPPQLLLVPARAPPTEAEQRAGSARGANGEPSRSQTRRSASLGGPLVSGTGRLRGAGICGGDARLPFCLRNRPTHSFSTERTRCVDSTSAVVRGFGAVAAVLRKASDSAWRGSGV